MSSQPEVVTSRLFVCLFVFLQISDMQVLAVTRSGFTSGTLKVVAEDTLPDNTLSMKASGKRCF